MALNECDAFFRVNPAGKYKGICFKRMLAQLCRVLFYGYGMKVHNGVNAVVFLLQFYPVAHGAYIVSKGKSTRWLNSAEYYLLLFFGHFKSSV
jgi:hypothetical protein